MPVEKIVKSVSISKQPENICDPMPEVTVTFDDGSTEMIFWYYPDELSFSENEFIGLTRKEAIELKFIKDKAYLQS